MTPERWRQVTEIFHEALTRDAAARASYLDRACAGDLPLREEIDAMLAAHREGPQSGEIRLNLSTARTARLPAGAMIGPCRIHELIGVGGMGQVYRARDTKLGRDVAIKILTASLALEPERVRRFEREARLLAALNHPNICAIHGLEDIDGGRALILELVEGPTLADRIAQGPIPIEEALSITQQIVEALETAHESGIIHRDLKPANIKLRPDGIVKVLDFGLAKTLAFGPMSDLSHSPMTTIAITAMSGVLGTPAYMSPEQVHGQTVDKRTDLWGVGCLLYEMVTGAPPFSGEDVSGTLARVLTAEPDWEALPPGTSHPVRLLLQQCLAKDPGQRPSGAADVRLEIRHAQEASAGAVAVSESAQDVPTWWRIFAFAAAGLVALLVAGGATSFWGLSQTGPAATNLPQTHKQVTFVGRVRQPTMSPDGQFLAYIIDGLSGGRDRLMVQDLRDGEPIQVLEDDELFSPFWSPDGSELVLMLWRQGAISFVPRLGGPARVLNLNVIPRSWSPDNSRFVALTRDQKWIRVVEKSTGTYSEIAPTEPSEFVMDVDWSPIGDLLVFVTVDGRERFALWTTTIDGSRREKIVEDDLPISMARWSANADLIYYLRGTFVKDILKLPVSRLTGKTTGASQVVTSGLQMGAEFQVSKDGRRLAYVRRFEHHNLWRASPGDASAGQPHVQLTSGTAQDRNASVSPDGRQVAFSRHDGQHANIFVTAIDGGEPRQITFLDSTNDGPVWSPDGKTIAFGSTQGGQQHVWRVDSAGGKPSPFLQTRVSLNTFHLAWAPLHGILYHEPGNRNFHFLDPITGEQHPLLRDSSSGWVFDPVVSPDGTRAAARWNKSDQGVGLWIVPLGDPSNATMIASSSSMRRGIVNQSIDASNLRGQEVKLLAYVKTNVSGAENHGHCLLRVERPEGLIGFVDEMETRPIRSRSWNQVEIVGKVDTDAERLVIGCFLRGVGDMSVDAVQLLRRDTAGEWTPIALHNPGFEERDLEMRPVAWSTPNGGYVLEVAGASAYQGRRALSIKSAHAFGDFHAIGWSPDGNHVYAFDNTDGRKIVAVRADGGEVRPLIRLSEAANRFWGGVVTPDGQHIVYSQGQVQTDAWIVDNFDSSR